MKPSTLAVLIGLYATIGLLLSLATQDNLQYLIATVTAVTLAITLGAAWPLHRGFAIAGYGLGVALAGAFFVSLVFVALTYHEGIYHPRRAQLVIESVFLAFAIFGGWTFVVSCGAAVGWLSRQFWRRPTVGGPA